MDNKRKEGQAGTVSELTERKGTVSGLKETVTVTGWKDRQTARKGTDSKGTFRSPTEASRKQSVEATNKLGDSKLETAGR